MDGFAVPKVTQSRISAMRVDAITGFAHLAIEAGFDKLILIAKSNGCVGIIIKNSYNCGVLGYHVEKLAEANLTVIGFTNEPASIAPCGGKNLLLEETLSLLLFLIIKEILQYFLTRAQALLLRAKF